MSCIVSRGKYSKRFLCPPTDRRHGRVRACRRPGAGAVGCRDQRTVATGGGLFTRIMRNVELWLAYNVVHGDLSAFNILWWEGNVTIIDVPQAVDPRVNPNARDLLARDIDNVCRYFSRSGVQADPARLAARLWTRFLHAEL